MAAKYDYNRQWRDIFSFVSVSRKFGCVLERLQII
jgi:hypothetical protein